MMVHMNTTRILSNQAIQEFKAIYAEEFDEYLSDDEAEETALRLLRFFDLLIEADQWKAQ